MADKQTIRYEVIGRAVVRGRADPERHYLKLLYRGDETPWWVCNAGLELLIDPEFTAQPGEYVTLTLERDR